MNKRIKEFRFKAAEYANEQKPLGITKWNEMRDEKFAELIVQECMSITSKCSTGPGLHDLFADEIIAHHFGVEE